MTHMSPGLRACRVERILAASLALALAGCWGFATPWPKSDPPPPGVAYVYGRFSVAFDGWPLALFGATISDVGLRLECEGREDLLIAFPETPVLQTFEQAPGRCVLAELSFRGWAGNVLGTEPAQAPAQTLDLEAGKAYYLGDWHVAVQRRKDYRTRLVHSNAQWKVDDGFEAATRELRAQYPHLAGLPVEDAHPPPVEFTYFHYESSYFEPPPPTYPMWR
jgi:hypothetical protein